MQYMQKVKRFKKLFIVALLASVLVAPLAIKSYAQESVTPDEETQAQTEEQNQEQEEEQGTETEESTPPDEEVVEEDEQPVDEEEEVTAPQEVDLAAAIGIAQAQHLDSEVIMAKVKLKKLSGEKVYKVVFADGWRIYVRASDGEIIRVKDGSNKKHECNQRARQAIANWRNRHYQKWGHHPSDHRKHNHGSWHKHKKDWRKHSQGQPSDEQTPVETEGQSEEQDN